MGRTTHTGAHSTDSKQSLKKEILLKVESLHIKVNVLLIKSQNIRSMFRDYKRLRVTSNLQRAQQAQNGQPSYFEAESEAVSFLRANVMKDTNEASKDVDSLDEGLRNLVKIIQEAKERDDGEASRSKRLRFALWLPKIFGVKAIVDAPVPRLLPPPASLVASGSLSILTNVTQLQVVQEGKREYAITRPLI